MSNHPTPAPSCDPARKFDDGKPQLDLIPTEALLDLGRVLSFGARKYGRSNWAKGLKQSRLYSAALRHLMAWNAGEDTDPESGLPHLAHALCNLVFMVWTAKNRPDMDDRWAPEVARALNDTATLPGGTPPVADRGPPGG